MSPDEMRAMALELLWWGYRVYVRETIGSALLDTLKGT